MNMLKVVVALVAITGAAWAQPLPEPAAPAAASGDAKIPISVPDSGEVLGSAVTAVTPHVWLDHPLDPATYLCGPGDVFVLDFWGTQNLRLTVVTDLEGRAFIAKVGFVAVAGKTLSAVRTAVTAKVRAIYPGLTFDLTLVSPRSFVVHVADNVRRPGAFTSRALDRVSSVIARAGGATGSRRRIAIRHHDGTTGTADLVRYELTGDVTYDPLLRDGDVISVPFASPVVTISGPVHRPGSYELVASQDVHELLELAGGFTSELNRALPLRLLRRNARQQLATTELPFAGDATPNLALQDDDQIVARSTEELQRTVLVLGAVAGADPLDPATTGRRVPYLDGDTVLSVLSRLGGIKAPGDLRRSYLSRARPGQPPRADPARSRGAARPPRLHRRSPGQDGRHDRRAADAVQRAGRGRGRARRALQLQPDVRGLRVRRPRGRPDPHGARSRRGPADRHRGQDPPVPPRDAAGAGRRDPGARAQLQPRRGRPAHPRRRGHRAQRDRRHDRRDAVSSSTTSLANRAFWIR